jgi:hypothetical protein
MSRKQTFNLMVDNLNLENLFLYNTDKYEMISSLEIDGNDLESYIFIQNINLKNITMIK